MEVPPPETGTPFGQVLAEFAEKVAPFTVRPSHPRFLAFIPSAPSFVSVLADWLVAADNPLTPRVLANRLWQFHFGTGIVATPNDFGYMGERPTHPELLDWLAKRLLTEGWRLKSMHKLIVTSQTYRQSSAYRDDAAMLDGDSRLLWRFPPRRLSAEEIRDSMLAISGATMQHGWIEMLFRGISSGFLMAAMVWLMPAAESAQFHVVALMTYLIGIGGFAHIVAGSVQAFLLLCNGQLGPWALAGGFTVPVLIGNIIGGTALFAVISYAQVMKEV